MTCPCACHRGGLDTPCDINSGCWANHHTEQTPTGGKCVVCGRPERRAYLCPPCVGDLEKALGDVPALADEVEITATRQAVTGQRNGPRSTTRPLPFDWSADHDLDDLRGTLAGWVRDLHRSGPWPADTIPAMARWLMRHLPDIAKHPAAAAIHDEISYAVGQSRRAIDRRPDRWYAGQCRAAYHTTDDTTDAEPNACCLAHLYVNPGAELFTCPNCSTVFDVADRRAELLAMAEDVLETATVIARAITVLDARITPERIRQWAARGRIAAKGLTVNGQPTYRVGDVIDRLTDDAERNTRRAG